MWDTEVDVVCVGAGLGGLGTAIAAVDAGAEVLVAEEPQAHLVSAAQGSLLERVRARRAWLTQGTLDAETDEYLAAVVDGIVDQAAFDTDAPVPVRVARNLSREEAHGRHVEPFVGSRLFGWASECVSSPYGLMYSSMRNRPSTTMRSADGDAIEVVSLGTVEWTDGDGENTLRQWLSEQVREREIEVQAAAALQRLVFEDGVIIGLVLSTPEGPCAVRTRHGVAFAPRDQEPSSVTSAARASGDRMQVCLVGRAASRFGRIELMATEPAAAPRPTCTGSRRQFREGLRDMRQPGLEAWRCGKPHGYPPLGQ
jgi:hypothetical protein